MTRKMSLGSWPPASERTRLAVQCGLLAVAMTARAADTNIWIATSGTGQWHVASNWSKGSVPGAGDTAVITNPPTEGTGYTVEIQQVPANPLRLTCGAANGQSVTLNVRTNLTLTNTSSSDSDWAFGPQGNVTINIFSNGVLNSGCQILGAASNNVYNVMSGGLLQFATLSNNKRFKVFGALNIQGSVIGATRAGELVNAYALTVDGGLLYCNPLTSLPTLLTNNPTLSIGSFALAGATLTIPEGLVTNRIGQWSSGTLQIAMGAGGNAPGTLNLRGGTWRQEGPAYVCVRPRGYLNIAGTAQFASISNVWVGSTVTGSSGYMAGYHGYVSVSNGLFVVSNTNGTSALLLGNITDGYLTCAGGTTLVDRVVLSNPDNVLATNATGKVTLAGGVLTVLKSLVATNGAYSVLACASGTLNVANANVDGSGPLVFGDGKGSATLGLLAGTHRFADGLVLTNRATLAAGGIGAMASPSVVGDVTLMPGAALHCDFAANAGETITLSGTLTLPEQAAVTPNSLDDTCPDSVVLVAADALAGPASLDNWTVAPVGNTKYRIAVSGTSLVLIKKPQGTVAIVR